MDIEMIKSRLLVKYPLFGSVIANASFIPEVSVKTAGTDGKDIYYNPIFLESISDEQKIFILAHEVCHIAFNHINRRKDKDNRLWNVATDSVINAFLKQDGLPLVEGVVDIPEAINYDAEEMYRKLLEEQKQNNLNNEQNGSQEMQSSSNSSSSSSSDNSDNQEKNNSSNQNSSQDSNKSNKEDNSKSSSGNGSEESDDMGHDTHSMWDKAIEDKKQEEKSKSSSLNFDKNNEDKKKQENSSSSSTHTNTDDKKKDLLNKEFDKENNKNSNDKDSQRKQDKKEQKLKEEIKKLTELGEKKSFKQNKIERKKQLEELRKIIASQSHGAGNDTNGEIRNIENIGISKPLIDWRRILKETIKYDVDWSYQNAGIEDGVVTPYLEDLPKPETEIVLDTSGSIDEILLKNFLRECKNILQASKVKIGCFDTKFYGFTEIKNVSDIDNLNFYGGGGTNFNAAINAFSRRVENKIIFTDGDAIMPSTPLDAIWIVFGNIKIKPLGGKVIYIDEKELSNLNKYNGQSYVLKK